MSINIILSPFDQNEVPIYSLGQLEDNGSIQLGRGKIISKKEMQDKPGNYPVYSSSATGDGEIGRYGEYMFDDERITWSIDGGGKLFYRNNIKYSVTNVGGWIKVNNPQISTKYLYYVLIDQWADKKFDYTRKAHPSVIRDEYQVPLPELKVQIEVCRVLDCFVELISSLEDELKYRRKQFDYYRDYYLMGDGQELDLEKVVQIIDCPHTSPKWQTEGIPVIRNYNLVDGHIDVSNLSYVSEDEYQIRVKRAVPREGDIMFSREAPIGNVGIIPEGFKCCQGQRVVLLRPKEEMLEPEYLLMFLQSSQVRKQFFKAEQIGSTVSNFNISDLRKLKIRVPSLQTQKLIVSKLACFDKLIGSTKEGIPAELSKRQKQYQYYQHMILQVAK